MIDKLILDPSIHVIIGGLVLVSTLVSALLVGWLAWRRQTLSRAANVALIATQLILMAQALIGIKLLDQGLGTVQIYIHYIGGLAPLMFFMLLYWLPIQRPQLKARLAAAAATGAFVFALMTF